MNKTRYTLSQGNSMLINILRLFAAQMVLFGHSINFSGAFPRLKPPYMGYIENFSVIILFVISGFLIFYSLDKKKDMTFGSFFINRFSRIYSALIPCLLLIILLDFINLKYFNYQYKDSFNLKTLICNIFLFQDLPIKTINHVTLNLFNFKLLNFNSLTSFGSARPLWTVAIEWFIYLFYGYLYIIMIKKKKLTIANWLIFLLLSIIPLSNVITGRGNGLLLYWFTGGIVFYLIKNMKSKFNVQVLVFLGSLSLCFALLYSKYTANYYDSKFVLLFSLGFFLFLVALKDNESKIIFKINTVLKKFTKYTYTLYLIHYSIIDLLIQVLKVENKYIVLLICIITSNVIALVMYEFGEKYSNKVNLKLNKIFLHNKTSKLYQNETSNN
ncbi:acyltransferase family protein [Clostridium estertheticum]|uniref:acyltransferase family protein n=1 Tax=Clostridium estertheticum TaxID=238834 RepID=UPI001CF5C07D|nr:acyltransferase [Clostridium estertheticum]MCB2355404.1 acyltransferase [Clostridium estertheticum]WAG42892.1 acyltransferase [Clostridium estertheticum]